MHDGADGCHDGVKEQLSRSLPVLQKRGLRTRKVARPGEWKQEGGDLRPEEWKEALSFQSKRNGRRSRNERGLEAGL